MAERRFAPVPLCDEHSVAVYRFVAQLMSDYGEHTVTVGSSSPRSRKPASPKQSSFVSDVVYYVQIGELIKIGTTADLDKRMQSYPPGAALLAIEVGGPTLEKIRLHQFKHLLAARREWFHPGDDLMGHIESLAAESCVQPRLG